MVFALAGTAALWISVALAACEEEPPQFTLQQVMFEIDNGRKDVERLLATGGSLEQARGSAESMEWWAKDAAFDRYADRTDIPANPAQFPALRTDFEARLAELSAALRENDAARARDAYPRLLSSCEACHAVYRPDLVTR
jgi:cytochrome c556